MDHEKQKKQQEICDLTSHLSSAYSDIGDWKIIKIYEARLLGKEDPYDLNELMAKRQAARERINELQSELGA